MTQELTTASQKTHVVITHSGGHYKITSEQNARIVEIGLDDLIELDGNKIKGSAIAEVMTMEKYAETYPEKHTYEPANYKRASDFYDFSGFGGVIDAASKQPQGLVKMREGLLRYLSKAELAGTNTAKSRKLLQAIEDRIAAVDKTN